jgi:cytochrome c-type biogenesis protein CcmH
VRRLGGAALAALVALAPLALALAPAAGAERPKTTLPAIEQQVMCPICGTLLELANSPQADRERAFIRRLIARGKSEQQIKDALVAQYGQTVLATPPASGFDLSAYLVPAIAIAAAALAIGLGLWRWRRQSRRGPPGGPAGPQLSESETEKLDADLARYKL